ncbi:helix-turn-helix transcriptional regulator [Nonomuraea sp. MCN248]|uniref:Helix-turn-helix transcriptional regulator n=1 Tax=Nonomuraea corallina TaxID=2989783 RepID=A0ABT4SE83_9ACTN|nr:helix-turn-helix transcriptional regulator [Nonomuraea corallina]MDA0635512.1 helix-turn-helix transcriptional regulator [Nonomuraea corallina]
MTTSDLIGLRIKTVRRQRGLSQAQLAHPELSDSYVSLIESGKRTPTPAVLELLAQKLDCSLSYLVNGVTAEQMEDIELALGYARLALENGEVAEARTRFTELLADNNLTGLTDLRQETEFGLALAAEACGSREEAITILERLRGEGLAPERQIEIAIALCRINRQSNRLSEAVEIGESFLNSASRPVWSDLMVELGATLLAAYLVRGDHLRARQFAAELLNAAEALGSPRAMAAANWNAAFTADYTGHREEVLVFAERALALMGETDHPRLLAKMRVAYAQLKRRVHPEETASVLDHLHRAVREQEQSSTSVIDRARARTELAHVAFVTGNLDKALEHGHAAADLLSDTAVAQVPQAHLLLGKAHSLRGDAAEADRHLRVIREALEPMPSSFQSAGAWYATAETLEEIGDAEGSVDAYQRALACAGL